MAFLCSCNGSLIHQVLQISAGKASSSLGDLLQIHILSKRLILGMNPKNLLTAFNIRTSHSNLTVKSSWTENSRIQNIHTVGGSHYNDSLIHAETIHLYQKLVQGLLSLIMAAAHSGTTLSCHSIDLINENNTWCMALAFLKKVSHTGCTYTDKHFHKVRSGNGEERNSCFPCNRLGKKSLTGTWRAYKDYALGDSSPHSGILLGILQEIYNLLQFLLLFLKTGNILEGNLLVIRHGHSCTAFAEIHHLGIGTAATA